MVLSKLTGAATDLSFSTFPGLPFLAWALRPDILIFCYFDILFFSFFFTRGPNIKISKYQNIKISSLRPPAKKLKCRTGPNGHRTTGPRLLRLWIWPNGVGRQLFYLVHPSRVFKFGQGPKAWYFDILIFWYFDIWARAGSGEAWPSEVGKSSFRENGASVKIDILIWAFLPMVL